MSGSGKGPVKPIEKHFELSDGFSNYSYTAWTDGGAEFFGVPAIELARFGAASVSFKETVAAAKARAIEIGVATSSEVPTVEENEAIRRRMGEFQKSVQEFSEDFYLIKIYTLQTALDCIERDKLRDCYFAMTIHAAAQLGAFCREYQLSKANRHFALSGRLDAKQRSEGGKMRARPDRDRIIAAMEQRFDTGKTIRQAARATFEVDGLGASEKANIGIWNRHQKNR